MKRCLIPIQSSVSIITCNNTAPSFTRLSAPRCMETMAFHKMWFIGDWIHTHCTNLLSSQVSKMVPSAVRWVNRPITSFCVLRMWVGFLTPWLPWCIKYSNEFCALKIYVILKRIKIMEVHIRSNENQRLHITGCGNCLYNGNSCKYEVLLSEICILHFPEFHYRVR